MATYTVRAPDGKTITLQGPDGASQDEIIAQAQQLYKPRAVPIDASAATARAQVAPVQNLLFDMAKSGGSGLVKGVASLAGMAGDAREANVNTLEALSRRFGLSDQAAQRVGGVADVALRGVGLGPSTRENLALVPGAQRAAGYQPQTTGGKFAKTAGEFLPSAVIPAGKAGLLARGRMALGAGIGSEAAGELTQGSPYEGAARIGGSLAGGVATAPNVARSAIGAVAPKPKIPVPSLDEMRNAKTAAYDTATQAGAIYKPNAVNRLISDVAAEMKAANLNPLRHPKAASMLAEIETLRGKPQSLTQLDQLRQVISRDVARAADGGEAYLGQKMKAVLDSFIEGAGPKDMAAGAATNASQAIADARLANTQYQKFKAVTQATESAGDRSAVTGSGGNVQNATRQRILGAKTKVKNWSPAELDAVNKVVRGTGPQNALRLIGKLSPQGNGLMLGANVLGTIGGAAMGGPAGAGGAASVGAIGAVSKFASEQMVQSQVQALLRTIAEGGPGGRQAQQQLTALAQRNPSLLQALRTPEPLIRALPSLSPSNR